MEMQRYVDQLLEDIEKLMKEKAPYETHQYTEAEVEMMEEFEDTMIHGDGIHLAEYCKIEMEHLPPMDELSSAQVQLLYDGLIRLLNYYNFFPEYHDIIPVEIRYEALRDFWETIFLPEIDIERHYDFCDFEPMACPFPNHCNGCEEFEKEMNDTSTESTPFDFSVEDLLPSKEEIRECYILNKKIEVMDYLQNIPEENFISGIYNYCDRWCERCTMTSKCANYGLNKEVFRDSENDWSNEVFWDDLLAVFQATKEMLEEEMKKHGIDTDTAPESIDFPISEMPDEGKELQLLAEKYAKFTSEWFQLLRANPCFVHLMQDDISEIIDWYHTFIPAKIYRALRGLPHVIEDDGIQNDSNGSAKIALVAIEKSILAWTCIMKRNPSQEDIAIKACIRLTRIKDSLRKCFPDVERFVRPGFGM